MKKYSQCPRALAAAFADFPAEIVAFSVFRQYNKVIHSKKGKGRINNEPSLQFFRRSGGAA